MSAGIGKMLVNRWLAWLLIVPLLVLIALTTLQYRDIEGQKAVDRGRHGALLVANGEVEGPRILNDYEDFYVVGRLQREGDIVRAYDNDYLTAAQQRFTGTTTFMPWAYPPPLTALVPLLPIVGLAWSYLLFMVATLLLYVWTLSRFGTRFVGASLLAVFPSLVLVVRLGQNGLLTGALAGLFLLGLLRERKSAGVPLGLMVIKPHLAIALGLVPLLQRRWTVLAVALGVVALSCLAATLVLGIKVWPAFFEGAGAAGGYLREGLFPLYRMSSVYAGLRSFGAAPSTAMAGHAVVALAALGAVFFAWRAGLRHNRLLALACLATLFISPYNYDYDLAGLAMALSLILPEVLARARGGEMVLFYALAWIGTGAGLAQHLVAVLLVGTAKHPHGSALNWSFQAAGLLATAALVARILRRKQTMTVVSQAGGQGGARAAKGAE